MEPRTAPSAPTSEYAIGMHAFRSREGDALKMYNDGMKRTTIVAPEELLDRLHVIAREENTSLADVIRQALEWRAAQTRTFNFVAAGESSEPPYDTGRRAGDAAFSPRSWR
jgi:hypothetical protein